MQSTMSDLLQHDTSLLAKVTELCDRADIGQLVNRYAHFIRTQNVEGVLSLFTDDAWVDFDQSAVDNGGRKSGKDALRPVYVAGFAAMRPWPIMVNHIVDFDSDTRAHGTVCIELRQGAQSYQVSWVGRYEDVYEKSDGAWKFKSRLTEVIHVPMTVSDATPA